MQQTPIQELIDKINESKCKAIEIRDRNSPDSKPHCAAYSAILAYENVLQWLDESSPSDNTQSVDKELAGKIWDAAERNTSQKLFDYTEKQLSVTSPDKETFINSLNLDNTQIRDGGYRREDMEKEYKRGFDDGVKYRDGQHKAYFTIES